MQWTARLYRGVLAWSLRHRLVVLAGTVAIFIGSFFLVRLIGVEFVRAARRPRRDGGRDADAGRLLARLHRRQGTPGRRRAARVSGSHLHLRHDHSGVATDKNVASIYVRLKDIKERTRTPETLAGPFRERLSRIAGISVSVGTPGFGGAAQKNRSR
jgi:HAE1 family hydrophobic/amphiphilic exporter-1